MIYIASPYIAILGAVALGAAITGPQAASIGTAKIWRATDGSLTEKIAYSGCPLLPEVSSLLLAVLRGVSLRVQWVVGRHHPGHTVIAP